jgi:hypothetical protein
MRRLKPASGLKKPVKEEEEEEEEEEDSSTAIALNEHRRILLSHLLAKIVHKGIGAGSLIMCESEWHVTRQDFRTLQGHAEE